MKLQRKNQVNSAHARVILLSSGGVCNRDIACRVGYTPRWVREIIHRFYRGGLEGIQWYPYYHAPGGPRRFVADVVEQIGEVALASPKALIGMASEVIEAAPHQLAAHQDLERVE